MELIDCEKNDPIPPPNPYESVTLKLSRDEFSHLIAALGACADNNGEPAVSHWRKFQKPNNFLYPDNVIVVSDKVRKLWNELHNIQNDLEHG